MKNLNVDGENMNLALADVTYLGSSVYTLKLETKTYRTVKHRFIVYGERVLQKPFSIFEYH